MCAVPTDPWGAALARGSSGAHHSDMGTQPRKPWVGRSVRLVGRIAGRSVTAVLAVLAGLGGKNVGPMVSSHERPPVPREEYRP